MSRNLTAAELRDIATRALADMERMKAAPANGHEANPNYRLGVAQAHLQRIADGNDERWFARIQAEGARAVQS